METQGNKSLRHFQLLKQEKARLILLFSSCLPQPPKPTGSVPWKPGLGPFLTVALRNTFNVAARYTQTEQTLPCKVLGVVLHVFFPNSIDFSFFKSASQDSLN